jgi:WD40 repeat protein
MRVRLIAALWLATHTVACRDGDRGMEDRIGADGGEASPDAGVAACSTCQVPNICCGGGGLTEWCGAPSCVKVQDTYSGLGGLALSAEWSPVDDHVLSGGIGELRLLRVDRSAGRLTEVARVIDLPGRLLLAWSRDGQHALTIGTDVRLFAVSRDPPALVQLARHPGHGPGFYTVALSPDGRHALIAGEDGIISLFGVDVPRGMLVQRADYSGNRVKVLMVRWSPRGSHALSVGSDRTLRLLAIDLDPPDIREVAAAADLEEGWAVNWASDGRVLTGSGIALNVIRSWSVDTEANAIALAEEIRGHTSGVGFIAWSPDGRRVLTGGHDDTIRLYDGTGPGLQVLDVWGEHRLGVHAISWSPDGRRAVLAGSQCDQVLLLDLASCPL